MVWCDVNTNQLNFVRKQLQAQATSAIFRVSYQIKIQQRRNCKSDLVSEIKDVQVIFNQFTSCRYGWFTI